MSLLEQNITRKKQVNKLLEIEAKLDIESDKKYKVEEICNCKIYAKEAIG